MQLIKLVNRLGCIFVTLIPFSAFSETILLPIISHDGRVYLATQFEVVDKKDVKDKYQMAVKESQRFLSAMKGGGVCGIPSNAIYDSSADYGYVYPGTDSILRLGPLAAESNTGPETYTHKKSGATITVTGQGKGIKAVAETVAHEVYHLTLHTTLGSKPDTDSDGVADADESSLTKLSTLANDPDTYDMAGTLSSIYASYGDNEIRGRKVEVDTTILPAIDPSKDWANPGSQSFIKFGP